MHHKGRFPNAVFGVSLRPENAVVAIMILLLSLIFLFLFITLTATPAQGQTFNVIYNFTGGADGAGPWAGLTMDQAGNFYGTTIIGGYKTSACTSGGCGTVFKLSKRGSGWVMTPLHDFQGGNDGAGPWSRVVIGPDGNLYGTTSAGGDLGGGCVINDDHGCGTVFKLRPPSRTPPNTMSGWTETPLYRFSGGGDGAGPGLGDLIFDQAGNIYGTTVGGGPHGYGAVFKMTPSNGGWTESALYSFNWGTDGGWPYSGVIFDRSGNLYGTTYWGGNCRYGVGCGTVFQLTPSGSGWTENVLYSFQDGIDGQSPLGGLTFDNSGSLYGTTAVDGIGGGGTFFKLTASVGNWTFALLFSFSSGREGQNDGSYASLVADAAGNLYGTTFADGIYGYGSVFKLTPSYNGWTYTALHDFTGGSDGASPTSNVTFDAAGNLYGTAAAGGGGVCDQWYGSGCGVVWEITP